MNYYVLLAALLAASVEFVEALTIVLAVGTVNGFKPALRGTLFAVAALVALVLVLGLAVLRFVPIDVLRGVIGVLLLLFGLKWIRKAILRFSGKKSLHDESQAFTREVDRLRSQKAGAFEAQATAFNGVFLEGLEVVVIVLTMGSAAVSLGIQQREVWLDLNYIEDSRIGVDVNVVMLGHHQLVEIQGTAEHGSFDRVQLNRLLDAAELGIDRLIAAGRAAFPQGDDLIATP